MIDPIWWFIFFGFRDYCSGARFDSDMQIGPPMVVNFYVISIRDARTGGWLSSS